MELQFKGVDRFLNICVLTAASRALPMGFDVSAEAPNDYEGLMAHFDKTGRVMVSSEASDHTIYGDKEVNFAFRAWHDWTHLILGLDFSPLSEVQVVLRQCNDLRSIYGDNRKLGRVIDFIMADGIGQVEYFMKHEAFPVDQKAFVLAYIQDKQAAISTVY